MSSAPSTKSERTSEGVRLSLAGDWTVYAGQLAEIEADRLAPAAEGAASATIDLGGIEQLDTAGAWLIDRSRVQLTEAGIAVAYAHAQPEYEILLKEARYRRFEAPNRPHVAPLILLLSDIGESVTTAGLDLVEGLSFLGQLVTTIVW